MISVYLWIMRRRTEPSCALRWLRSSDSLRTRPEWISTSSSAGTPRRSARPHFSYTHTHTTVTVSHIQRFYAHVAAGVCSSHLSDAAASSDDEVFAVCQTFHDNVDRFGPLTGPRFRFHRAWHAGRVQADGDGEERAWEERTVPGRSCARPSRWWLGRKLCGCAPAVIPLRRVAHKPNLHLPVVVCTFYDLQLLTWVPLWEGWGNAQLCNLSQLKDIVHHKNSKKTLSSGLFHKKKNIFHSQIKKHFRQMHPTWLQLLCKQHNNQKKNITHHSAKP